MGIRREQPGATQAAATTGSLIGAAQKAEETRAAARQKASQERQIKASEEREARAMQWETDKLAMRSQQDFAEELRQEQFQLDKVQRAREWDVEKMEIASRLDFDREEKDRQIKLERIDTQIAAIDKEIEAGRVDESSPDITQRRFDLNRQRDAAFAGTRPGTGRAPSIGQEEQFGVTPWYLQPAHRDTAEGEAARIKAETVREPTDSRPWFYRPEYAGTPEATKAQKRYEEGLPPKERSERQQLIDIVGDWASDLSLPDLKSEAQQLGMGLGTPEGIENIAVGELTDEQLRRLAGVQ